MIRSGETNYYSWDQDNRLTSVSNNASGNTVRFVYDHTGKRVKKLNEASGDTIYASRFYEKHNGLITRHIFDGTRRIVSEQSDGSGYWYHTDHLGSTMFLTSTNGQVVQEIGYYAYGETRTNQGTATNIQYKFTGQEFDPETVLYYYNARYYDPEIGRFISADCRISWPFDPQALSRYTYTRNNPVQFIDPTGHDFFISLIYSAILAFGYWLDRELEKNDKDNDDGSGPNQDIYLGFTTGYGEGSSPDDYYTDPTTGKGDYKNKSDEPGNDISEAVEDYNAQQDLMNLIHDQFFNDAQSFNLSEMDFNQQPLESSTSEVNESVLQRPKKNIGDIPVVGFVVSFAGDAVVLLSDWAVDWEYNPLTRRGYVTDKEKFDAKWNVLTTSVGTVAGVKLLQQGITVGNYQINTFSKGNVFKIINTKAKWGYRIDPAHHRQLWGHRHFWRW